MTFSFIFGEKRHKSEFFKCHTANLSDLKTLELKCCFRLKLKDFKQQRVLKTLQVKALTASVVKVRKAVSSSGEAAGLEDLKGQKGEEGNTLEIKPRSPRRQ